MFIDIHSFTGETQSSLSLPFRLGQSTISEMIEPVCKAIYSLLDDEYLKTPSTEQEWKVVTKEKQSYESPKNSNSNFSTCIYITVAL